MARKRVETNHGENTPAAGPTLAATTETAGQLAHPLAQQILECDDQQTEVMTIEEWGGVDIQLRSITAGEASQFANDFKGLPDGSLEPIIYLVVRGCCDPKSGERILEDNMGTRQMLAQKQPGPLNEIARKILRLSGLGRTEKEAHKDAEKN